MEPACSLRSPAATIIDAPQQSGAALDGPPYFDTEMEITPSSLAGPWKAGHALALHTVKSEFLGYDEQGNAMYDTTRSAVFIGGSRKLSRLNEQIRSKLAEITERGFHALVGDANGADRAVQAQLRDWGYSRVTVFFVGGGAPRNNEGSWPTERVAPPSSARGADYYGAKDIVMARNAEAGLMIWDGESKGTLANVRNLVREHKPVAVYVSKQRRFKNVLDEAELRELSAARQTEETQSEADGQSALSLGISVRAPARKRRRRAV